MTLSDLHLIQIILPIFVDFNTAYASKLSVVVFVSTRGLQILIRSYKEIIDTMTSLYELFDKIS